MTDGRLDKSLVRRFEADQWRKAVFELSEEWLRLPPAQRLIEADRIRMEHHGGVLPGLERTVRRIQPPWC